MQAPADLNPYAIAFTSFCQQSWSSGRRLLMLRHCSVSIVEDASPPPSTWVGGALGGNGGSCRPTKVEVAEQQKPNAPKCLAYPGSGGY